LILKTDLKNNNNINFISFVTYSENVKDIQIEVINDFNNGFTSIPFTDIFKDALKNPDTYGEEETCPADVSASQILEILDSSSSSKSDSLISKIVDSNKISSSNPISDSKNTLVFKTTPITGFINNHYIFTTYSKCASIYENNVNPVKSGICYPEAVIIGKYISINRPKSDIDEIILYDDMYNKIDTEFVIVTDTSTFFKVSIGSVNNSNNVKIKNIIILTTNGNMTDSVVKVMKSDNTTEIYSHTITQVESSRYEYSFNYYNNMLSNQFVHKTPEFDCSKVPAQHFVTISRYIRSGLLTYLYAITDIRLVLVNSLPAYTEEDGYKRLLPNVLTNENSKSEKYLNSNTNMLNGLYEFGTRTNITPKYNIVVQYTKIDTSNMNNIQIITDIDIANNFQDITIYNNPQNQNIPTEIPKFSTIKKPFSQLEEGEKFLVSACYLTKKSGVVSSIYETFNITGSSNPNLPLTFNGASLVGKDVIFDKFSKSPYFKEGISGIGACYNMFAESMFYHAIDNTYNPSTLPPEYCNA
jgi:hypothetical protein